MVILEELTVTVLVTAGTDLRAMPAKALTAGLTATIQAMPEEANSTRKVRVSFTMNGPRQDGLDAFRGVYDLLDTFS